jgi:uncharacterized protein
MLTKQFAFELDTKSIGDTGTFEGLASVYGKVDDQGDIVERGAFTKSITTKASVPLLYQHNQKIPIGGVRLEDTDLGLKVYGELVLDVPEAKGAHGLMKRGVLKGLSIGFPPNTVVSVFDRAAKATRLKEIDLWEVSLVTFQSCPGALVTAVKSADQIKSIRDFEEFLRDAGFPKAAALALAAKGWNGVRRDADTDTGNTTKEHAQLAALLAARTQNLRRLTWN